MDKLGKKVLIGMSGGVDSSVACFLLKEMGYNVTGFNFRFNNDMSSIDDAQSVCDTLGVPLISADFSKEFNQKVFEPFIKTYQSGETPNICVECNKNIKFGVLLQYAIDNGYDYIATGHYCDKVEYEGHTYLALANDSSKDQTYFLSGVKEDAIKRVLFPLAKFTKEEVRGIAEQQKLITAHKKGSSDICIVGDRSFRDFISGYIKDNVGEIRDINNNLVGHHKGLHHYTLGQRKGLDLGGRVGESGRWFIVKKDIGSNTIYVSHGDESPLYSKAFVVGDYNLICQKESFVCQVKTRYRSQMLNAKAKVVGEKIFVELDESERAITVGQQCAFYFEGRCLGGGRIIGVE